MNTNERKTPRVNAVCKELGKLLANYAQARSLGVTGTVIVTAEEMNTAMKDCFQLEQELEEAHNLIQELRRKLAFAGVEGSPPPGRMGTIPELRSALQSAEKERDEARALNKLLREAEQKPMHRLHSELECVEFAEKMWIEAYGIDKLQTIRFIARSIWRMAQNPETVPREIADGLARLVEEVMSWHSDRESSDYNQCDTELCFFCEQGKGFLAAYRAHSKIDGRVE